MAAVAASAISLPAGAQSFTEVANAFGTQPCLVAGNEGCYTNYLVMADIDGDEDLDLLLPNANGYFVQNAEEPFVVYGNDGAGVFTNESAGTVGDFSGWIRQVAVGDVDADGDLDLYAPDAWGGLDKFYVNDGTGVFADEAATRLGESSRAGAARFGDVDGDGDLDLVVSDWGVSPPGSDGTAKLYLNDGAGNFMDATTRFPILVAQEGTGPVDLDFGDIDGDFDLDLLIDGHDGNAILWRNDGSGTFSDESAAFPDQPSGFTYDPVLCDVDGDGDLDVWQDNAASGQLEQLLINDGTGEFEDRTTQQVSGNVAGSDDNGVACVDLDGDGDLDAAIASLSTEERALTNDGAGVFTAATPAVFPTGTDPTLWLDFGDVNGDGKLDLVTGQGEGVDHLDRLYLGSAAAPIDDDAPVFRAIQAIGTVGSGQSVVFRFAVVDNAVTDVGPRVSSVTAVADSGSGPVTVEARFVGGDLFRTVLPGVAGPATVTYRACATDRAGNTGCSANATYPVSADPFPTPVPSPTPTPGSPGGGGGNGCGCALYGTGAGSLAVASVALALVTAAGVCRRRNGSSGPS